MDIHSPGDALGGLVAYDGHGSLFLVVEGQRRVHPRTSHIGLMSKFRRFLFGKTDEVLPFFPDVHIGRSDASDRSHSLSYFSPLLNFLLEGETGRTPLFSFVPYPPFCRSPTLFPEGVL